MPWAGTPQNISGKGCIQCVQLAAIHLWLMMPGLAVALPWTIGRYRHSIKLGYQALAIHWPQARSRSTNEPKIGLWRLWGIALKRKPWWQELLKELLRSGKLTCINWPSRVSKLSPWAEKSLASTCLDTRPSSLLWIIVRLQGQRCRDLSLAA